LLAVQLGEQSRSTHQQRPPREVFGVEFVVLGRVELASGQVPTDPCFAGQLIAQLQAHELVGCKRNAHTTRHPQLHRARRHLKKIRHTDHREAEAGEHRFELAALFHAGLRAATWFLGWRLDIPRCISRLGLHDIEILSIEG
jgi:hypothetical protein